MSSQLLATVCSRARQPHRGAILVLAVIAGVAPLLVQDPAGAATYHVGGAGCTHPTIAAALLSAAFSPEDDLIILTRTVSYTNVQLTLTNWNPATTGTLTLAGGVDDCGGLTFSGTTTLAGNGSDPVITVSTTASQVSNVTLSRLRIHGGSRGLDVSGDSEVGLFNSELYANGTGLRVTSGGRVEIDTFVGIHDNSGALFGGGIHCADPTSEVTLHGVVYSNQATSAGGGIFASNFCQLNLAEGGYVQLNAAPLGGGIYLQTGARMDGGGGAIYGARVTGNIASNAGGGFYIQGASGGARATLSSVLIDDNTAANLGGGVALVGGGLMDLERSSASSNCPSPPRCASLSGNSLSAGGLGSAAYVAGGSHLTLAHAFIEQNSGPGEAGFVLFAEGAGSAMSLEGVQLWDNRTVSLFQAENAAHIEAGFVSAARNDYLIGGVPPYWNSRGAQASGGATVEIFTSILDDQRPFTTTTGGIVDVGCVLLDTLDGATIFSNTMVGADPRFLNAAAGNLRLRLDSPAIDSCNEEVYAPVYLDLDLEQRGFDFTSIPNILGPYDRGADEIRPLFADGFESGDPSQWSSTVPCAQALASGACAAP